jgi:hypothetical protein
MNTICYEGDGEELSARIALLAHKYRWVSEDDWVPGEFLKLDQGLRHIQAPTQLTSSIGTGWKNY